MSDVKTEDAPTNEEATPAEPFNGADVFDVPDAEFLAQENALDTQQQAAPVVDAPDTSEDPSDAEAPTGDAEPQADAGDSDEAPEGADDEAPGDDEDAAGKPATPDASENAAKPEEGPDYLAIGKQVMAEFKANGKPISMKTAEDVIALMQMGVNYHSKMTGLKPSLKVLKLLEKNDLLDESKINYLIDLSQKNPGAIKQLLQDSKLDPMEIDMDSESSYEPVKRVVSDTEIVLDEVLADIAESPKYAETLNVLGKQWDDQSRKIISDNPEIIKTINGHMESGIYYQVAQAVDYEKRLGKLTGLSDFQAYQQMGEYMEQNKLFRVTAPPVPVSAENPVNTPAPNAAPKVEQPSDNPKQKEISDADRLRRKSAASPTRKRKSTEKARKDFNPLEMSDEEFMKLNNMHI